jgi:hypothetical protein
VSRPRRAAAPVAEGGPAPAPPPALLVVEREPVGAVGGYFPDLPPTPKPEDPVAWAPEGTGRGVARLARPLDPYPAAQASKHDPMDRW